MFATFLNFLTFVYATINLLIVNEYKADSQKSSQKTFQDISKMIVENQRKAKRV